MILFQFKECTISKRTSCNYANLLLFPHDRSKPLQPKDYKFDPVNFDSVPTSQPTIIVDSSTVEHLKTRLNDVDKRLKASEAHLKEKEDELAKLKPSM